MMDFLLVTMMAFYLAVAAILVYLYIYPVDGVGDVLVKRILPIIVAAAILIQVTTSFCGVETKRRLKRHWYHMWFRTVR